MEGILTGTQILVLSLQGIFYFWRGRVDGMMAKAVRAGNGFVPRYRAAKLSWRAASSATVTMTPYCHLEEKKYDKYSIRDSWRLHKR